MTATAVHVESGMQILHTPAADVEAGEVIAYAGTGIAVINAASTTGRPVGASITGVFEFDIDAGTAYAVGDQIGVDLTNKKAVPWNSSAEAYGGLVHEAISDTDTSIRVKINALPMPAIPS